MCAAHKRARLLLRFLEKARTEDTERKVRQASKILIFVNTAVACKEVHELLVRHGHARSQQLHGKLPQKERDAALLGFRAGKVYELVATDVAGRGLDVKNLQYVVNWDFPPNLETYTHRVGRAGRDNHAQQALKPGDTPQPKAKALSFFTRNMSPLAPSLVSLLKQCDMHVQPQLQEIADERLDRERKRSALELSGHLPTPNSGQGVKGTGDKKNTVSFEQPAGEQDEDLDALLGSVLKSIA